MSTPNQPDAPQPDGQQPEAQPPAGYEPPQYHSPSYETPHYGTPGQAPGAEPPAPEAPQPAPGPEAGSYPPPAYQPPAQQAYQPPAQPGYQTPPQQGYQTPPQPGYPLPGQQANPYGAQPGYPAPPYPSGNPVTAVGELAHWGTRALGGLVDYVAPSLILSLIAQPFAPSIDMQTGVTSGGNQFLYMLFGTILPLAWMLFNSGWKQGTTGQSYGKQIAKIKLVSEATGQPIGFGLAVVRHIAHFIDSLICFIGWLFPLWDAKRQTIADKLMKTVVVRAE